MIDRLRNMSLKTMTLILVLFSAVVLTAGLGVYVHESQTRFVYAVTGDEDEAEDTSTMSFYSTASSFARVMGYISAPDYKSANTPVEKNIATWEQVSDAAGVFNTAMKTNSVGTAASLLGYFDAGDGAAFFGWLQTLASGTSTTYNYKSLQSFPNLNDSSRMALYGYGLYGYGMNLMGFDSTAGSSLGIVRLLGGGLFLGAFVFCFSVDFVFRAILYILKTINPFSLFVNVVSWSGFAKIDGKGSGFGSTLASMVSSLYDALSDISFYVLLPVFIGLCAFTFLVLRNTDKAKSMFRKILTRILFVVIGIPILASMYTASLDQLTDTRAGASNAAQITAATFFDFEKWVYPSAPTEGTPRPAPMKAYSTLTFKHDVDRNTIDLSDNMYLALQDYCYTFNKNTGAIVGSSNASFGTTTAGQTHLEQSVGKELTVSKSSLQDFADCTRLLLRYMAGSKLMSSDYESYIKTEKGYTNNSYATVFTGLRRVRYGVMDNKKNDKFGLFSSYSGGSYKKDGTVLAVAFKAETTGLNNPEFKSLLNGDLKVGKDDTANTISFTGGGLSYLGAYNYLNTDFNEKSMSVYSPSNASSFFVMKQHYSVNMVGTGMLSFMYWLNSGVSLVCLAYLGLFYGFGILFGNLKRGFKILMQVPFAVLGGMKSIARVISWSVMMMIEILVTLFLYQLLSDVFLYIPKMIASPIINLTQDKHADGTALTPEELAAQTSSASIQLPGTDMAIGGYLLAILIIMLSVIAEILFTIMAVKLRKSVVKAVDEEAARIVEQVVGVQQYAASELPKQPGALGNLASNALAAGGAAMAMDKMAGGKGAAFEKSASAGDTVDGVRTQVGTGDGAENSEVGKEAAAGEDAGAAGAAVGAEGEGAAAATAAAQKDMNDKMLAATTVQQNSLGGNTAAGDTISEENHTEIVNEGGETSNESSSESNAPIDISNDDVARMAGGEQGPVDVNNADVRQIADAARDSARDGKDGEGGKGGDGVKGEDGKDAEPGVRSVHGGAGPEQGAYQDEKGRWHHADGTRMTGAEAKAHKAELAAQKAEQEQKEQQKHRYDGTKDDRKEARRNLQASQEDIAGLQKGLTRVSEGEADKMQKRTAKAEAEAAKHKAQADRAGEKLDSAHEKVAAKQQQRDVRTDAKSEKAGEKKAAIEKNVAAMQREGAAKQRAHEARVKQAFPHAVDRQGNFHPEALRGVDKAKYDAMEATHGTAMQLHQHKIAAAQGKADVQQGKIDSLAQKKAQGAKAVADHASATAAGKAAIEDRRQKRDNVSIERASTRNAYTAAGASVRQAKDARTSARTAYQDMKRSHVYIPGVAEQVDAANSAVKAAKTARREAGTQAARQSTQGVRAAAVRAQQAVSSVGQQVVSNMSQQTRSTAAPRVVGGGGYVRQQQPTVRQSYQQAASQQYRPQQPRVQRMSTTVQASPRERQRDVMREFLKTQAAATVIERVGGRAGAAAASGLRTGSAVSYMEHTGVIHRAGGGSSDIVINPMAMAMMMTVMQQSVRRAAAPSADVNNIINRTPDGH